MLLTPRPGETVTFRSRVAGLYRGKGYEVRENSRVRGQSGNIYAVDMVASGPLGALLVSFGDAAGVDGPEVGRVRTIARDIGATPVIATPTIEPELRRLAAQMAVVVMDEAALDLPPTIPALAAPGLGPDTARTDLDAHPWPESGRAATATGPVHMRAVEVDDMVAELTRAPAPRPTTAPGLWTLPREQDIAEQTAAPAPTKPEAKFAWLGVAQAPVPTATAAPTPVPAGPIEHEATLLTRDPTLQERASELLDVAPLPRWAKITFAVLAGALLFFLLGKALS